MKKRAFTLIIALIVCLHAQAFKTEFIEVNFSNGSVTYKGETYELIEVRNNVRHRHREVSYYCITEDARSVVFRLFVRDNGQFFKLLKFNSVK